MAAVAAIAVFTGVATADCLDCLALKDCPQTCAAPDAQCPKKCNAGGQSTCECNTIGVTCFCTEVPGGGGGGLG